MVKTKNTIFRDDFAIVRKTCILFQKITKRSSEIVILVKKYEILNLRGSFGNFFNNLSKYFSEMEKMESFLVFKTFFLISKMDKNKCPIFILKKKFQKMKSLFFLRFFLRHFFAFLHDT